MQSMNLNGMQVIVLSQPGLQNEQQTPRSMKPRLAKQLIGLGVVHILNGVFCIIFQSIGFDKFLNFSGPRFPTGILTGFGQGFWSALIFLVTGIIGITTGRTRKISCLVIAFNILSIISGAVACIMTIVAAVSAYFTSMQRMECDESGFRDSFCTTTTTLTVTTLIVMESMIAAMGFLETIIALWSSIVCCLIGVCNCCHASPPQTQPLILSAEQQAALMSNPMFMSNQQQSTVGFNPQQQMIPYTKEQQNARQYLQQSHPGNNFMSAGTGEGSYTGLNYTGSRRDLPSVHVDTSTCNTTSVYEELHEYDEIEQASVF